MEINKDVTGSHQVMRLGSMFFLLSTDLSLRVMYVGSVYPKTAGSAMYV